MKTINSELVKKVAQNTRVDAKIVKKVFDGIGFSIPDCLVDVGSKVYIKNIGTFELVHCKKRATKINGKIIIVPERDKVNFKMSKVLGKSQRKNYGEDKNG